MGLLGPIFNSLKARLARRVILNDRPELGDRLAHFAGEIEKLRASRRWTKQQLVDLFRTLVPEFAHQETGKYLDDRM